MLSTEYTKFKGTGFKIKIEKVNKREKNVNISSIRKCEISIAHNRPYINMLKNARIFINSGNEHL